MTQEERRILDEAIKLIESGGKAVEQGIYDYFYAPSLIADPNSPMIKDWGKPIPCEEIDNFFSSLNFKTTFDK